MKLNTILIFIAAIIALSAGITARHFTSPVEDVVKDPLPEFSLPDINGKQRNISEWRGKVLIINFWATWCPPCLKEIPEFIKLQQEFGDRDLQFIGIAIEDIESVQNYLDLININYPTLIGEDAGIPLSHQLGNSVNAVPFSLIVDKKGNIIHQRPGELSRNDILKIVTPLL